jgi:DNA-binding NarL/FixJ family response regulator
METLPPGKRKSSAQDFLQSLVVEQRGATEELKAICRELQSLLDDLLLARPELGSRYQQLSVEQDHPEAQVRQAKTVPQAMSMAQCQREAERNVLKSAELIRESGQIRQRSKAMRATLRGATPLRSKVVAENKPLAAQNGTNGRQATNGSNSSNHGGLTKHRGLSKRDGLSKREFQVLHLIVNGKTSKEVAAELGISFKTAVTHRASIMSKLDVHETASVVREAISRGLV